MQNTWIQLIIFCNQYGVGEIIKRRDILQNIKSGEKTINMYVLILRQNHYLHWVKPGHYKLLKKIPECLKTDGVNIHKTDLEKLFDNFDRATDEQVSRWQNQNGI